MGKSKETQNSTITKSPYDPAQPAIKQSISGVQNWLSNPASSAAYQGGMSGWTKQGLDNLGASTGAKASSDYLQRVVNGDYLNAGNPYQSDLDASIRSAVMPSINATFSNAGMAGSTMHQGMLMKGLTEGLAAPRYQSYQAERGNQQQAAGLLPTVDNQITQNQLTAGQTSEAYDRAKWEEDRIAGLRPYLETAGLLQGYGNMGGTQTGTTTTTSKTPLGETLLGAGMMGAQMAMGVPTIGGMRTVTPGMGLIGNNGLPASNTSGAYAPELPWGWNQGANPAWPYSISRG